MAVVGQPFLNSSPVGLRAIADRPPGSRESNRVWSPPIQPGGLLLGETVGSIAVSEKDAAGSKRMPGGALVTNWATQIPSIRSSAMSVPSFEETAQYSGRR
jgi:hypothetical protein